jgi:hypothetical protein
LRNTSENVHIFAQEIQVVCSVVSLYGKYHGIPNSTHLDFSVVFQDLQDNQSLIQWQNMIVVNSDLVDFEKNKQRNEKNSQFGQEDIA